LEIPGGGQVTVEGTRAYVGHMEPPLGTTILDVSDLKNPRVLSQVNIPPGTMSHKVRVSGDVMLVNHQQVYNPQGQPPDFQGGLKIFDVSDPRHPKAIGFFPVAGRGVHRFDFDGRYAYISAEMEGYVGHIVVIVDLKEPERPEEVSRWWFPGQHLAGEETPDWEGRQTRCHHPLRYQNRLYVSYWHGGFVILDIEDLSRPHFVSHLDWSPPYPCPTHTALRIPHKIMGRDFLAVTDEEVDDRLERWPRAFFWMVDITDETRPVPVATYQVPHEAEFPVGEGFGAHQSQEQVYDNTLCVTWFSGGLRVVDISNPYQPCESGYHIPPPGAGADLPCSNDVFMDPERRIYLIDRYSGFEILEFEGC
jgi:hypothetical protein